MKPEDISQEVLDSADGLWTDLANYAGGKTRDDETVLIARAIIAAEKRGEEREREACAQTAATYGANMSIWMSSEWPTAKLASNYAGQDIADAIRNRRKS